MVDSSGKGSPDKPGNKEAELAGEKNSSRELQDVVRQLNVLTDKVEAQKKKDKWDKFQIASSFVSTVLLAFLGTLFTLLYNHREADRQHKLLEAQIELERTRDASQLDLATVQAEAQNQMQESQLRISELTAINALIPHLASKDPEVKRLASMTLQTLSATSPSSRTPRDSRAKADVIDVFIQTAILPSAPTEARNNAIRGLQAEYRSTSPMVKKRVGDVIEKLATSQATPPETRVVADAALMEVRPSCAPNLAACPDEGCGAKFDPNLNRRKNIRSDDRPAIVQTMTWIERLPDPKSFADGQSREGLASLGEGQKITVVAYLLVARREARESCNCELWKPEDTDNHLVLVSKETLNKFPVSGNSSSDTFRKREAESITAEFTPRVRLDHPNFTREKVQPLIDAAPQRALLVRITGLLLFDTEHFIRYHLLRMNNWEIHPVLRMEFCISGDDCDANTNTGWRSLDAL
jgi:hypothetical protein